MLLNVVAVVMILLWLVPFMFGYTFWGLTYAPLLIGGMLLLMQLDSLRLGWLLEKRLEKRSRK